MALWHFLSNKLYHIISRTKNTQLNNWNYVHKSNHFKHMLPWNADIRRTSLGSCRVAVKSTSTFSSTLSRHRWTEVEVMSPKHSWISRGPSSVLITIEEWIINGFPAILPLLLVRFYYNRWSQFSTISISKKCLIFAQIFCFRTRKQRLNNFTVW